LAGFEPLRVKSWLLSRDTDSLDGERPLECVTATPGKVLHAASIAAAGRRLDPGSDERPVDIPTG
jgi:hypothetical protein